MTILQPAINAQSAAKIGIFGKPGSGKTLTSIFLLIGLAKREGNKPIAMLDTEGGSDFVADICRAEGVPLLVAKGRSFVEMRDAHREAQAECSGFLVDSYSEPWKELNEALRDKLDLRGRRLQFQHRDELYLLWGQWVREMLDSPLHCVLSGRLSNEWDEVTDDAGDIEHVRIGTKMRGEADAGYEPHLLIEMDGLRDSLARDKKTKSKRGRIVHTATVLKDRFRALNGRSFPFPDLNQYAAGGYEKTFKAFADHIACLAPRESGVVRGESVARSSVELFASRAGESAFAERARRVTIAIENIQAALSAIWAGQTADEKRMKAIVLKTLFNTRSWTEIEGLTPEAVEGAWQIVQKFETEAAALDLKSEAQVTAAIAACKAEVQLPAMVF